MTALDAIISLGGNCEVAYQTRRHFGIDNAHIFDWWITPFHGLIDMLDSDFVDLLRSDKLSRDRVAVKCERYGVFHHHDFRRDGDALVIIDDIDEQLNPLREKYAALRLRLFESCKNKRVLFVRSWREILHEGPDYPKFATSSMPPFDFIRLVKLLEFRFPTCDFQVLFVNYGDQSIVHPRMIFRDIIDHGDANWAGSAGGWDQVFEELGVKLR